jgi:hypothetical protein
LFVYTEPFDVYTKSFYIYKEIGSQPFDVYTKSFIVKTEIEGRAQLFMSNTKSFDLKAEQKYTGNHTCE